MKITQQELESRIVPTLQSLGITGDRAALAARLIAETDRDGVTTHGIARLPRFAAMVRAGSIRVDAVPTPVTQAGALERWTGERGPGNLAAHAMTARAMELAREHGIGAVALGETTHWQRGGTYGWQAAEEGFALLAWTNTLPNLPPWGATSPALGNNPLVIAVPRPGGAHVVLDMAMSQFSYGALAAYAGRGEALPVPGGFDQDGILTTDAAAIERSQRALPVGFWKGSGLAFVLDLLAAMLADSRATHQIAPDPLREVGLSQVFVAIRPDSLASAEQLLATVDGCVAALHAAEPVAAGQPPRYPGEGTLQVRERSRREGVSLPEAVWSAFEALEGECGIAAREGTEPLAN